MQHKKIILMIAATLVLTLALGGCSTVDGFMADVDQAFSKADTAPKGEVVYLDPLPDGTLPAGVNGVLAPTSQMDLSYDRVAADVSNSSVELFSLDAPGGQPVTPRAYNAGSRQSAGRGSFGIEGVPSSSDESVTVFPFTSDMYTPGIKPGLPGYRNIPRGYNYADGSGSGPSMMAHPATQIEDVPLYLGSPNIIYFNHGSAALNGVAREVIASVAKMQGNRVIVEAHASKRAAVSDPVLRAEVNFRMSMKRAMVVTKALIAQGVPEHMIKTTALGDTKPAVPEVDSKSEALNRRVEILSRP